MCTAKITISVEPPSEEAVQLKAQRARLFGLVSETEEANEAAQGRQQQRLASRDAAVHGKLSAEDNEATRKPKSGTAVLSMAIETLNQQLEEEEQKRSPRKQ